MEEGVDCFVENVNNSKGIIIITKSKEARNLLYTEMLFKIVKDIQEVKVEFCRTVTLRHYLMDSINPASFTDEDKLFATNDILRVLKDKKHYIIMSSVPMVVYISIIKNCWLDKIYSLW